MSGLTYGSYIRVDDLLGLQQPRSPRETPLIRAWEHFFIVVHQAGELWLSQVLLDLDEAVPALKAGQYADAEECLRRSVAVLDVMAASLDTLAVMPPGRFACFRGALGQASGGQSAQFAALDRRLGLTKRGDCPLSEALAVACEAEDVALPDLVMARGCPGCEGLARVVSAMLDLARKIWKWKVMHLELVAKMIGHGERGTGGTAGTAYLADRLAMPFPELWDCVSGVHGQGRVD
ncbi:tryptophan 2,3-dioxygenase [Catenulispora sp. GAS73]|uniref:tryptophan 2,3-dioxygenase family protein n=1 Tax=Catenulispora sp. GAS73 TaxID=3156269 RepID=UPI0035110C2C